MSGNWASNMGHATSCVLDACREGGSLSASEVHLRPIAPIGTIYRFAVQRSEFRPEGDDLKNVVNTETLGALIRKERKHQGLTQEQLAAVSGVGIRFLRELEAGKESCQLGRSLRVLSLLGLCVDIRRRQESD